MELIANRKSELADRALLDYNIFNSVKGWLTRYGGNVEGKSILDIGCGRTFPQPLLYNTFGGSKVVGIDITSFVNILNLPEDITYYYVKLEENAGRPLKFVGLKVMNIDAQKMPFPDNTFDFVVSNAAFEHIENVPAVIVEMRRVMKKGAVGHIGIHLYPSLSGSHHPLLQKDPLTEIPNGVVPWYHLRGIKGYEDTPLNKWREYQYKGIFNSNFEILDWRVTPYEEGRQFLTKEIKLELSNYAEEELLRRWCIAIIRKN